jgi:hypothetical protein
VGDRFTRFSSARNVDYCAPIAAFKALVHYKFLVGEKRLGRQSSNPTHHLFLFESRNRRLQKPLRDLNGTDPNIHVGIVSGVRKLCNAFVRTRSLRPGVPGRLVRHQGMNAAARHTMNCIFLFAAALIAESQRTSAKGLPKRMDVEGFSGVHSHRSPHGASWIKRSRSRLVNSTYLVVTSDTGPINPEGSSGDSLVYLRMFVCVNV